MSFIRRRLFVFAMAWLVCQAGSIVAFMPQDCCPAHRQPAAKDCHEQQPAAGDQCPMHQADGKPCPMHTGAGDRDRSCTMSGTCNAPAAALTTLLSIPGILVDQSPASVADQLSAVILAPERSPSQAVPLDTPPPRA